MINYLWGGLMSNQVGVEEFVDLCREVKADPLIGVNFAADGRPAYIRTATGEARAGTAEEAADLVTYCNDSGSCERKGNGRHDPFPVRLWQLGNETSYPPKGKRFTSEESARTFLRFSKAMRARDPEISLIGWGGEEHTSGAWWAGDLLEIAGEHVDYVATHMMRQRPRRRETILWGRQYREDIDRAWAELNEIYATLEPKIDALAGIIRSAGSRAKIAITEGHLTLKPHNHSLLLTEWLSGLYHARVLNLYERWSHIVEIATLADFCGNRWTVNAVVVAGPHEPVYLLPVGSIMKLYRRHVGRSAVSVRAPSALDVTASVRDDRIYLHVVNTDLHNSVTAQVDVAGRSVRDARVYEIAPDSVLEYVDATRSDVFEPVERRVPVAPGLRCTFPKASVSVVELDL